MSVTVSEKPWSDYSASDYSPEQWHSACLIHQHEGAPTSKGQCKLPVRTPDGTLNRGGVQAAAAALAGARGGVDASSEEKSDAASALVKLYRHLDEDPPESLQHAVVDEFLAHYGTRGMRWGFRRSLRGTHPSARAALITKKDAKWSGKVNRNPKLSKVSRIAARDTKKLVKKTNKDYKARGLNIKKDPLARSRYDSEINGHLQNSLGRAANRVHKVSPSRLSEVAIHRHPDGRIMATIVPRTNAKLTKQFGKIARTDARTAKSEAKVAKREEKAAVTHADDDVTEEDFLGLEFMFLTDEDDFVTDVVTPFDEDEVSHMDLDDFLTLHGTTTLQHASAEVVDVKPASDIADKTRGTGNGKFDESKVKRDQGGKFSTKEERRKLREKLDDGWAKKLDALHGEILGKHTGEFKKMMADVAKKHDIDVHEINGNKAAKKEYEAATISMLNEFAKKDGVSPSGNQRVEFTMGSNGQPKPHVVSHEGPNPNHEDTRSFIDSTIKSRQARSTVGAESTANASRVSSVTADQNKHAWWKFHHDDMVDSFVSRFDGVSLQHAAAAVAGGSSDSKGDGKGGSKFDESKVKRDGGGKFSKIAAKRREDRQDMKDELDKGWLDNLDWHRQSLVEKHMEELTQMAKDIAEKHGIKDYSKGGPGTKAANQEFAKELIPRLNKWAADEGVNISPSGNKRMEFRLDKNTGEPKSVVSDYSGPNPNSSATRKYINDSFEIRRVSRAADREEKAEGPGYHSTMFNPDAKLDTSRVHDASDSAETGDTSGQRHWWEFWHSDLINMDAVEEFLAHHGIKGMKWGVRRSDSQLSRAGGRGPKENSTGKERSEGGTASRAGSSQRTGIGSFGKRSERKSDFGDVPGGRSGGGYARSGGKKKGDDDRLSADAERSLKTSQKKSHEMSDREMKEAIGRANQIKQYNQLFGTGPKSDLENAVAQLQLQKQYKDLQAQLNPPKVAAVKKFASGAAKGFAAYQQVDQAFGGQLTSTMSRQLGLQKPMSPLDKIKLDNDFLAATKSNITLKADVNELSALKSSILNGDSPSKAVGYLGAGKRRAVGSHKPIF